MRAFVQTSSIRFFLLSLMVLVGTGGMFPAGAHAEQRYISDYVRAGQGPVARGEFLTWTVNALKIQRTDTCDLEGYKRVPRGMIGTLCAVQSSGALDAFGSDLLLGHPITRGEALYIVSLLTKRSSAADIAQFRDVRTPQQERAVKNAVAHRWMNPLRHSHFGVTRVLNGTEALTLLQAVTGETPRQNIRIRIEHPEGPSIGTTPPGNATVPESELMNTIWQIIQRDYLHANDVDPRSSGYNSIEGLVQSLNDPYSTFFRPAEAENFHTQIRGELSGIGAHVEDRGGAIVIVAPLPGSPAEKAGLKPGDEVLEADGNVLTGIGVDNAVSFIRGEKGTSVVLTIRRGTQQMSITVVRDLIVIPEVEVTWNGEVAIVRILQFGEMTNTKIRDILAEVAAKKPRGLVIDLRNNPGGLLNAADVLASNFLPEGTVVAQVKGRESTSNELTRGKPTIASDTKVAVLVNGGSASASEIVAGALQDHKRAVLVGTKTFGKGTVQELLTFQTGEALKLTIAEWFTPFGRKIDGVGLVPDIVTNDPDEQLRRAIEAVR